jgi:predicted  nucleic acid-binding Zn-ribbon protein
MENQQFINLFFGVGLTVMGWFARELWAAVKELKADLAKLRENLPKDYIAKDDYKEDIREIKSMLAKIFEKLENKADK